MVVDQAGDRRGHGQSRAVGALRRHRGGAPPPSTSTEHVVADGAVDPGALQQVRRRARSRGQPFEGLGEWRERPTRQSGDLGVLGRASARRPMRVADEQHRGRDPRRAARIPASWPATGSGGRASRPPRGRRRSGARGRRRRRPLADTDSAVGSTDVPSRSAPVARRLPRDRRLDRGRSAPASVAQRASSQAVTHDGTALVPLGSHLDPPEGRPLAPASRACLLAASAVIA